MDVSHFLHAMGTEVCYDVWVAENTWKMEVSQLSRMIQSCLGTHEHESGGHSI
jgi:hypothetical protein